MSNGRSQRGESHTTAASCHRLVEQQWLADVLDFWNGAFEVECFGENDLENLESMSAQSEMEGQEDGFYLLHIDAVTGAAEDEAGSHSFGKAAGLCTVSILI